MLEKGGKSEIKPATISRTWPVRPFPERYYFHLIVHLRPSLKHCPECGTELYGTSQEFCQGCGSDLTAYEKLAHQDQTTKQTGVEDSTVGRTHDKDTEHGKDATEARGEAGREHTQEPIVFELDQMTGYEFEEAVVTLFRRLGYEAEQTSKAADEGRDVLVHDGEQTIVVECKHQKGNIGRPVVQKLQAATSSYPGATQGIVLTSGDFADTARKYAKEASQTASVDLKLWDHTTLVQKGQEADLYFATERRDTDFVFRPGYRSADRLESGIRERHLESLACEPRDLEEAVSVRSDGLCHLPAILVEYDLDRDFESATYHLHRAQDHGRKVLPLDQGVVPDVEKRFWEQTNFNVTCEDTVEGQPVEAHFGEPLEPVKERVARRIAQKNTTTVSYKGKNNQRYTKHCQVEPSDVSVDAKQVMLLYHEVGIDAGPHEHAAVLTADRSRDWLITETIGFDDGDAGFRQGTGFVCNDCGLISPAEGDPAGAACEECDRTLCASHHWTWPKKAPWSSPDLCSSCYEAQDHDKHHLVETPEFVESYVKTGLSALLPGAPFAAGGRLLAALAFLPVWLFMVAGIASSVETGNPGTGVFWVVLGMVISALAALYWSKRVRTHQTNVDELEGYEPVWTEASPRTDHDTSS